MTPKKRDAWNSRDGVPRAPTPRPGPQASLGPEALSNGVNRPTGKAPLPSLDLGFFQKNPKTHREKFVSHFIRKPFLFLKKVYIDTYILYICRLWGTCTYFNLIYIYIYIFWQPSGKMVFIYKNKISGNLGHTY